jgi:hypothetical protein
MMSPLRSKAEVPLNTNDAALLTQVGRYQPPGADRSQEAGIEASIGRIERFPDGARDWTRANNRRLGHD